MRAIWKGTTIAQSDETVVVEGNHYFPPSAIVSDHFEASDKKSYCGWKGEASYYNVVVAGDVNRDAAWFYPTPKDAASQITGYIAFWKGVEVVP